MEGNQTQKKMKRAAENTEPGGTPEGIFRVEGMWSLMEQVDERSRELVANQLIALW